MIDQEEEEMKKSSILLIDDQEEYLRLLEEYFKENFETVKAHCEREAIEALKEQKFDAVMVDVRLGSENGIEVGKRLREIDSKMSVILMTGDYTNYRDSGLGFDDYIIKGIEGDHTVAIIQHAIYQKKMSRSIRIRRLELLRQFLPKCKEKITGFYRQVDGNYKHGDVEKLVGKWASDKTTSSWVVYNLPEHGNKKFTIGVASSVGCGKGGCKICLSGPLIRFLDWEEIICQVLYGLDSFHAQNVFDSPRKITPWVNFTCEGEPFSNLENVMKAVTKLLEIEDLGFEFIITSIGLEKELDVFIEKYSDLPRIKHYHSVNSCIQKIRKSIMPGCDENIFSIRDKYQIIAERTGKKVTESIVLLPGINDNDEELLAAKKLYGEGRPFEIKLQAYKSPEGLQRYPTATEEQLEKRKNQFLEIGIDCRIREVIGSESFSGCGSTIVGYPQRFKLHKWEGRC